MTEAEWLACLDSLEMVDFLMPSSLPMGFGKVSERKLRLFGCACCRRIWRLLTDPRSRRAGEAYELFSDNILSGEEREAAEKQARMANEDAYQRYGYCHHGIEAVSEAVNYHPFISGVALQAANAASARNGVGGDDLDHASFDALLWEKENQAQSDLLRCIFGPLPFRPVTLDPAWHSANVTGLAEAIYDERAFDRLPILADALEDAGCTNEDILSHCRGGGEHVRGCWMVDLVLGKE
ncbi:hypothetical protein AYO44_09285 [Planctomycetaceae bacterium SCGC AG-212-F19]|nr:hypothetical protein AYO44_09285 [Planctomycetaceae bacterium SCGC AG-212-F19]